MPVLSENYSILNLRNVAKKFLLWRRV
jgi:hypothetical protein